MTPADLDIVCSDAEIRGLEGRPPYLPRDVSESERAAVLGAHRVGLSRRAERALRALEAGLDEGRPSTPVVYEALEAVACCRTYQRPVRIPRLAVRCDAAGRAEPDDGATGTYRRDRLIALGHWLA